MKFKELESVFIVAEMSANHNGSIDKAKETIKAAKRVGADAIKLQTYRPETITLNLKTKDFLIRGDSIWSGQNLYNLIKKRTRLGSGIKNFLHKQNQKISFVFLLRLILLQLTY